MASSLKNCFEQLKHTVMQTNTQTHTARAYDANHKNNPFKDI